MIIRVIVALLVWCSAATATAVTNQPFDPKRLNFAIEIQGLTNTYSSFFAVVLPGEELHIRMLSSDLNARFEVTAEDGLIHADSRTDWVWTAPVAASVRPLQIRNLASGEVMEIWTFVAVPASAIKDRHLHGYRIGEYPKQPLRNEDIYLPPVGFIEVQAGMENIPVSPHFQVGQFLCKQAATGHKYLVLQPRLIQKLELVLEEVNAKGVRADTFAVLSGYRTPYYNKAIGNVQYSRHVWGDAADVYIDNDGNGWMDDINQDGKIDKRDAAFIYDLVNLMVEREDFEHLIGGMGEYRSNRVRGPFVHIDARGRRARWGR